MPSRRSPGRGDACRLASRLPNRRSTIPGERAVRSLPGSRPQTARLRRPAGASRARGSEAAAPVEQEGTEEEADRRDRRSRPSAITSTTAKTSKIPPHRVLAINRGERAKVLRVKIECRHARPCTPALDEMLVPPGHPHADYLRGCARDALGRLILPGLEREARRELTDRAEIARRGRVRPAISATCSCSRRSTTAACWRSIRASRAAASWPRWTSSATCWGTT